jgi:hypothetical protein
VVKRTPLERGDATLRRGKPLQRRTRPGAKRKADPVTAPVHGAVMARDRACVARVRCDGQAWGLRWHHRLPVEHGGPSTISNGLAVCDACHHWIHNQYPAEARENGWLVDRRDDPAAVPVLLPGGRRVLLTDDGWYADAA